jgi:hypothetical protein
MGASPNPKIMIPLAWLSQRETGREAAQAESPYGGVETRSGPVTSEPPRALANARDSVSEPRCFFGSRLACHVCPSLIMRGIPNPTGRRS